jgi:hypothetical protein
MRVMRLDAQKRQLPVEAIENARLAKRMHLPDAFGAHQRRILADRDRDTRLVRGRARCSNGTCGWRSQIDVTKLTARSAW